MAVLKYKDPVTGEWLPSNSSVIPTLDKEAFVKEVIEALGTPVFGRVDEENNIILSGELVSGTYNLKYENADGSTTAIGTLSVSEGAKYTNLADPSSADWLTNKRINSSKNVVDVTDAQRGSDTVIVTNFISDAGVQKFHVKGLDIMSTLSSGQNYGRYYWYNSSKEMQVAGLQPSSDTYKAYFSTADYDSSVTIIDVAGLRTTNGYVDLSYMRLGGILTGAASDVIITADEQIV